MSRHNFRRLVLIWIFCLTGAGASLATGQTLAAFQAEVNLTPERFLRCFSAFHFKLGKEVQPPEVFLANKSGDCDDFATLVADVLRKKGYTVRLVVVHMHRDTHVVCYVAEVKAFLDYNHRQAETPLVATDGSLKDIATKVAADFHEDWYAVSEFTYEKGVRHIVLTDFH